MSEEKKPNGLTLREIIEDVHDDVIMELDGYSDENFITIMEGLIEKLEGDVDSVKQEIRFHKSIAKNGQTASN